MCEKCLYKKNCQFLAKHKKAVVEGCTGFLSEDEYKTTIKAEAVKEFAERFEKSLERQYNAYGRLYVLRHIEKLVKEMVGENK